MSASGKFIQDYLLLKISKTYFITYPLSISLSADKAGLAGTGGVPPEH